MVNSRMKLDKPVPYNVTEAVHCVLEDFCNAASKRLDIEIDSRSLEVEPGEMSFLVRTVLSCVITGCGHLMQKKKKSVLAVMFIHATRSEHHTSPFCCLFQSVGDVQFKCDAWKSSRLYVTSLNTP